MGYAYFVTHDAKLLFNMTDSERITWGDRMSEFGMTKFSLLSDEKRAITTSFFGPDTERTQEFFKQFDEGLKEIFGRRNAFFDENEMYYVESTRDNLTNLLDAHTRAGELANEVDTAIKQMEESTAAEYQRQLREEDELQARLAQSTQAENEEGPSD